MNFSNDILYQLTLVFIGASCLGTLLVMLRQPVILGYLALGVMVGQFGFGLLGDDTTLGHIGELGIIFLLFVEGLSLSPDKLFKLFKQSAILTAGTSLVFGAAAMVILKLMGFGTLESLIAGAALMFSSTLVALKLIPTTALHHQRVGSMMVSVLLFQDILAIILLVLIMGSKQNEAQSFLPLITLLILTPLAWFCVKKVIFPLFKRYDTIQEFIFILSIGWCFLLSYICHLGGASYEIGAFLAGTLLATSPVAYIIAERLKPLREFFLILFFFAVGAQFNWQMPLFVFIGGIVLTAFLTLFKPLVFYAGYRLSGEKKEASKELGIRLGQVSEFTLLVSVSASGAGLFSQEMSMLVNWVVMLSFAVSTLWVVRAYPTPIGGSKFLCKD